MSESSTDIKFAQRFSSNLFSNIAYFVVNIIIGLLLTPYFLDTLGPSAYGLIPLATSITSYVTLVIDALNTSISRYLTIDIQRGDFAKANVTFNSALFGTLAVIIILIPIALVFAWFTPNIFQIGTQSAISVFILFSLIFGSVLVRAWSSNFMVTLFARNRLDLRNYVNIINIVSQVFFIVLLFTIFSPSLISVGVAYISAAALSLLIAYIFSRKVCPYLHISIRSFSRTCLKEIGGMSVWVLINGVTLLLNTQIALILVNIMCGEVANTEYSLAATWASLLISISSLLTNLFVPMIYSLFSLGKRDELIEFTSSVLRIVGILMALPVGLVCIFSSQILTIWVGEEYSYLAPLMWITVAPVLLQIMVHCISPITVSFNRVRGLVLWTLPIGVLNLLLAIWIPQTFHNGIYGIALAGMITLFLRYAILNPVYIARVIQVSTFYYMKKMIPCYIAFIILFGFGLVLTYFISIDGLIPVIIASCVISIVYILIVPRLTLTKPEKSVIKNSLSNLILRKIANIII